jgi:hypothetical protein
MPENTLARLAAGVVWQWKKNWASAPVRPPPARNALSGENFLQATGVFPLDQNLQEKNAGAEEPSNRTPDA